MRKVVYYLDGLVADFPVPDAVYEVFATRVVEMQAGVGEDLEKARGVLRRALDRFAQDDDAGATVGHAEVVVAPPPSPPQPAPRPPASAPPPSKPDSPPSGVTPAVGVFRAGEALRDCDACPPLVEIRPGSFVMGATSEDPSSR